MSARKLPHFSVSSLLLAFGLAVTVGVAAAPQTTSKPPSGTATPASSSQGAAGRGANAQQPQGQNRPGDPGGRPLFWWQDATITKAIGLKPDQATRIEGYFNLRAKDIEPLSQERQKHLDELGKLMADRTTDRRTVEKAIELQTTLAEALRVEMNKSFNVMLFRISRVLDDDQLKKLKDIQDQQRHGRGGN